MKIDLDVMKQIFNVFIDSPDAFIELTDINSVVKDQNELKFYAGIMIDNQFISGPDFISSAESVGYIIGKHGERNKHHPIRLTQKGHDFATILNQQPVLEKLKEQVRYAPLDLLLSLGKAYGRKLIKDRIGLDI